MTNIYSRNTQPYSMNAFVKHGKTALPKESLVDGQWYSGHCRNSAEARWSAAKQRFEYIRTKFTMKFVEEICHPADDQHFDVFYPFSPIPLSEVKEPINAAPVPSSIQ